MGLRDVFTFGSNSRRSLRAGRRPRRSDRRRFLRIECLETRRLLSNLTPAQVAGAYGVNQVYYGSTPANGAGQTIALLDAGDDSHIAADLAAFDSQFGLPAPPSFTVTGEDGTRPLYPAVTNISEQGNTVTVTTASAHGLSVNDCFQIKDASGKYTTRIYQVSTVPTPTSFTFHDATSGLPTESSGVTIFNPVDTGETALDVEWAHAMAPGANIVLVEMSGSWGGGDVVNGVHEATSLGAHVVSMSFGGGEYNYNSKNDTELGSSTSQEDDGLFTASGVAFVAATGDTGAPGEYPAFSPNVLAVGATNLYLSADGSYAHETGWSSPAPGAVTAASESGNTVTLTTASATGLTKGAKAMVSGVGTGYNGTWALLSGSGTTLTYTDTTSGLAAITPAPAGIRIASAAEIGNRVTITTAGNHGLAKGDRVEISGVGVGGYNGVFSVTDVQTTTFSYLDTAGLAVSSGGTVTAALVYAAGNVGGSGGGISQYETQPACQQGTVTKVTQSTTNRTIPDVSFVGGSPTPVAVYNNGLGGLAGTSVSAPAGRA
jgi:hypothetical protein